MKKILFSVIISLFLCLFVLIHPTIKAGYTPWDVDQSYAPYWCTDRGGCNEQVIYNNGLGQTFIPTQNRLDMVQVYLRDVTESSINLKIVKFSNSEIIAEKVESFRTGDGWKSFMFNDSIIIEPGTKYIIKLITPDNQIKWVWYNNPDYENGSRLDIKGGDYLFMTLGSTYTPAPEEEEETESSSSTTTTTATTTSTISTSTITTSTSSATNEPGDEASENEGDQSQTTETTGQEDKQEVEAPDLLYVIRDSDIFNSPISEIIVVEEDDILKIVGTSVPDSRVVLSIGGFIFSSEVNSQGEWEILAYMTNIDIGEFDVLGQTQVDDTRESKTTCLFKIVKQSAESSQEQTTTSQEEKANWTLIIIIGIGILIILVGLLGYILWKKKMAEKKKMKQGTEKNIGSTQSNTVQ